MQSSHRELDIRAFPRGLLAGGQPNCNQLEIIVQPQNKLSHVKTFLASPRGEEGFKKKTRLSYKKKKQKSANQPPSG